MLSIQFWSQRNMEIKLTDITHHGLFIIPPSQVIEIIYIPGLVQSSAFIFTLKPTKKCICKEVTFVEMKGKRWVCILIQKTRAQKNFNELVVASWASTKMNKKYLLLLLLFYLQPAWLLFLNRHAERLVTREEDYLMSCIPTEISES